MTSRVATIYYIIRPAFKKKKSEDIQRNEKINSKHRKKMQSIETITNRNHH